MKWWPWWNTSNPDQRLEQWVSRLQRQLRQVKRAVAVVVATQRRLRRQLQGACSPVIRQELQQALAHQSRHCRRLQQQLLAIEQQVQALQARREILTARVSTAEARKALHDLRQHISDGPLPHLLQDTEDLVHRLEAEVELLDHSLGEWVPPVTGR
ncbi:MAG: hypothetical protein RMI89_09490 [Gloeomargarita sp. SKYBB_i_bin120]|nr:hypothetical protein [Gloeomargarita sp. SKYG98]MCS7293185.1 hypothetical protein [Gloeomargarita sp. SKYB120]MDW8178750.1 hypothetical protein [Gloeomargarita sp. SKYBB_i_bin120]